MTGLSICIPVYNFNCTALVQSLILQIQKINIKTEVIVIDDSSIVHLKTLSELKHDLYSYKKLEKNVGRAKIRNLLTQQAKYNHLLFLDCDSEIKNGFIELYIGALNQNTDKVLYGGTIDNRHQKNGNTLRNNYGNTYEYLSFDRRNEKPYHNFRTNNFLALKSTLIDIPFNEELTEYGHEDTFFSYQLYKSNIEILHINNPVVHSDTDSNSVFINKTKTSIKNLFYLKSKYPDFINFSRLLTYVENHKLNRYILFGFFASPLSMLFEMVAKFTSSTRAFQLFKLFYAISLSKRYDN